MQYEALEKKLLAAARSHPPGDQVPYAFEQRILARLKERKAPDALTVWSQWLWRAAVSSLLVTLLAGLWALTPPSKPTPGAYADDFESLVYAGLNEISDSR
jgi:ABC-type glycerol-3-phosphate transport system substrate-binding protein